MITITNNKSQLELNLEKIDSPLVLVENCVKTAVHNLNESFSAFWGLPDTQIEEIMNYKGLAELSEIFEAHFKYANGFNELLEDRGISEPRAITTKPRDITVDGNGVITLVSLPEPEIVVEPEPVVELDPEIVLDPIIEEPTPDPVIEENLPVDLPEESP